MANGQEFFNANKPTRNEAFSFSNQSPSDLDSEVDGNQAARVHPFPADLGVAQKVGNPLNEPAPQLTGPRDREGLTPTAPQIVRD